jgi:hypothetical protein
MEARMDPNRFDTLLRYFSATPSRRDALQLLASSALGLLGWAATSEATTHNTLNKCKKLKNKAKRKKCLKKAKAHNATHTAQDPTVQLPPPDPCAGKAEGASCGTDRACCGGTCVNLRTNPNHCGRCGYTCSPNSAGSAICHNGGCACPDFGAVCPSGCGCRSRYQGGTFCTALDATCVGAKQCPNGDVDCDLGTVCHECNTGQSPVCIAACQA